MFVEVYSKDGCQPCKATVKKLMKEGVSFEKFNLDDYPDRKNEMRAQGHSSAPLVIAYEDGQEINRWAGFRPDSINSLR